MRQAAGLKPLVDYSKKKTAEKHMEELKTNLAELVAADPPLPVADLIAAVKGKKQEWQLPGEEVIKVRWPPVLLCEVLAANVIPALESTKQDWQLPGEEVVKLRRPGATVGNVRVGSVTAVRESRKQECGGCAVWRLVARSMPGGAQRACVAQVVWSVLIDAVPTHGRNAQQITGVVQKQIKTYAKLLNEFTTTAKQEAALLVHVQARTSHPFLCLCKRHPFSCLWVKDSAMLIQYVASSLPSESQQ